MEKLMTPFGEIIVSIDGAPIDYCVQEGSQIENLCPHVLGRYRISVTFVPDGEEHNITCGFAFSGPYKRTSESGERLECQSSYNDQRYKMSIGLECEAGCIDGIRLSDEYDYNAEYLENGMSYLIGKNTKTERYVFGIAWIDNVGWDDLTDNNDDRAVETWYGADPTLAL